MRLCLLKMRKIIFDTEDKKPIIHEDCLGQVIEVGDEVVFAISSTRLRKAIVMKICPKVIIVQGIPGWKCRCWSSALYVLKRK